MPTISTAAWLLMQGGAAAGGANAIGAAPAISLATPGGVTTGAAGASGAAPSVSFAVPAGIASGGANGIAAGLPPAVSLVSLPAAATGAAGASGAVPGAALAVPAGIAASTSGGGAFGLAPAVSLAIPPATVSVTTPAISVLVGTDLGAILSAAAAAIVAAGVADARAVHPAMKRPYDFPYPGKSIVIFPGSIQPIGPIRDGGGRHVPAVEADIITLVVDRHARDAAGIDPYRLTDATAGLYATDGHIINVLKDEFLIATDGTGNSLTYEPLEWVVTGEPRPYGRDFAWSGLETTYRVKFLQRITVGAGD